MTKSDLLNETQPDLKRKKKKKKTSENQKNTLKIENETEKRIPLSSTTNVIRTTSSIAAAVAKIASINAASAPEKNVEKKENSSPNKRFSSGSSSSWLDDKRSDVKTDQRLSDSERMAFEAEKMHLRTLLEAHQAEEQVRDIQIRTERDDTLRKNEKLQKQLHDANRKIHDLSTSKHELEVDLIHAKQMVQDLEKKLEKANRHVENAKAECSAYRTSLEECRKELTKTKTEKCSLEKRLQKEITMSTKLSSMIKQDKSESESEKYVSPPRKAKEYTKSLIASPPYVNAPSPVQNRSVSVLDTPSTTAPTTPKDTNYTSRPQQSASVSYTPYSNTSNEESEIGQRHKSLPRDSTLRGTAPVIYNEPRNKEKKQQYATLLQQQIEENRNKKRKLKEETLSTSQEYFPFGRPGSGAPVRDQNCNVVTNITYARRKSLPDHLPTSPLNFTRM